MNSCRNPLNLFFQNFLKLNKISAFFWVQLTKYFYATLGEGYIYVRGLLVLFLIDASLTDDEPL